MALNYLTYCLCISSFFYSLKSLDITSLSSILRGCENKKGVCWALLFNSTQPPLLINRNTMNVFNDWLSQSVQCHPCLYELIIEITKMQKMGSSWRKTRATVGCSQVDAITVDFLHAAKVTAIMERNGD